MITNHRQTKDIVIDPWSNILGRVRLNIILKKKNDHTDYTIIKS